MPAWILGIVTHIGFKVISIILGVALIFLVLFSWIKLHDAKIKAQALTTCPKTIKAEAGSTINIDQTISKIWCFPIPAIGHFGIGFCHD